MNRTDTDGYPSAERRSQAFPRVGDYTLIWEDRALVQGV